jgi:competence protein ComGC
MLKKIIHVIFLTLGAISIIILSLGIHMGLYQASSYTACQYSKAIGAYERYGMEPLVVTPTFFEGYGGIILSCFLTLIFILLVLKRKTKWAIYILVLLVVIFLLIAPGLVHYSYYPPEIQQAGDNLEIVSKAIEEYATANNGWLPGTLDELVKKGYLKKDSFIKNAYGTNFVMEHAAESLNSLKNSDILVIDSNQPNASYMALYADGRIERIQEIK